MVRSATHGGVVLSVVLVLSCTFPLSRMVAVLQFSGLLTGHAPARRSDQELFKTSRVKSGRVRGCGKSHG